MQKTVHVKDVTPIELARQLGISRSTCAAFLQQVQERVPEAKLLVVVGNNPTAVIYLPFDDELEMTRQGGLVTIGCNRAHDSSDHLLVPKSSVTDPAVVKTLKGRYQVVRILFDEELTEAIAELMKPVYDRIDRLSRQGIA